MNWTGGALSRSRNANASASLSAKQKNHFAKARVKLQNEQRPSPPEIQYFDFGEWKPRRGEHDDRRSSPVKRWVSRQRTLDQFENVQGVVRKLKSLRPRNEGNRRKRSVINDTEGHVLPSGIAIPPISPITISSRPSSSSSPVQCQPTPEWTAKRLRTSTSSTRDEPEPLAVLDSVEAKRRKLLQESDWVGVDRQKRMSKPVKMKFTDAGDRDLIGRRRPLNGSAVQNRWNVQRSLPAKIPPIAAYSEKRRDLHRGLGEECCDADGISIRIGSAATNKGPVSDEILDCYQSPGPVQRSSNSPKALNYDNAVLTPKPQHRRRGVSYPSAFRDESSELFRSLFSPEEVEQPGIAQLLEAATIPDTDDFSLAEDELRLPEDYHFPEPEPEFRLVFEQKPQPHDQISELNDCSSPVVRDFAYIKGQLLGTAIEQRRRPKDRNGVEEQNPEYAPVEDASPSTSPLSVATSRYMRELEDQSFGSGGRRFFAKDVANQEAIAEAQDAMNRNRTEEKRGTTGDREPKVAVQPNEFQNKKDIQPTEDEDEIWRNFINFDDHHDFRSSQEHLHSTQKAHATTARASMHSKQVPDQTPTKSNAEQAPPSPRDDDELVWQKFIFSDSGPNNEWIIEEAASAGSPPDNLVSPYNPARTQASMVAEAATSPVKQNPHLLEEMLDEDSRPILDDASRHAHASTNSPTTTANVSSTPQQTSHPSSSPSTPATPSPPSPHSRQNHSNALPLRLPPTNPNPRLSHPSSLIAEAPSSSIPPTHSNQPQHLPRTTAATNNHPSSEQSWTPSRLANPSTTREKVVFKKPSRYVGARASDAREPVHLGRNVSQGRKGTSLAEAVERAKGKAGRKARTENNSKGGRDEGHDGGEAAEETDRDDIVDD